MRTMKTNTLRRIIVLLIIINPLVLLFLHGASDNPNHLFIKFSVAESMPEFDMDDLPNPYMGNLSEEWYDQPIEMLVVIPEGHYEFAAEVQPLVDWKNEKGVKTVIANASGYSGEDKAAKIRNLIRDYHENEGIQWVLLCGDTEEDLIPIREVYNPDIIDSPDDDSEYSNWDDYYKPTDFYYADLTGDWDDNNNGRYGESAERSGVGDEIDWSPDVYVGRLPASNAQELGEMVNKTLKYETNPEIGTWMNRMLLAGARSSTSPAEDEARLTQYIWKTYALGELNFTHLYSATSSFISNSLITPPSPNEQTQLTTDNFDTKFNDGYSTVMFAGHGDPQNYKDLATSIYDNTDASGATNTNMPSLVYGDACTTSSYDKADTSIGEILIKQEQGGAIGYIGGLRVTWYYEYDYALEALNRACAKWFWYEFFENHAYQQGKALYDSKMTYLTSDHYTEGVGNINYEWERKNILTYCLLGDPEVDIYTNIPGNISNPFPEKVYEGQFLSLDLNDQYGRDANFARVNLKTEDGKYRTVYADEDGIAEFRLLPQDNETYEVLITGHNVIPTYFNFTTLADEGKPVFRSGKITPEEPTVTDNVCFEVDAYDSYSGIEGMFAIISDDDFSTYDIHTISNLTVRIQEYFERPINKLDPGEYRYLFVARDYAGNIEAMYDKDLTFNIPIPLMSYILVLSLVIVAGIAAASSVILLRQRKNHAQMVYWAER